MLTLEHLADLVEKNRLAVQARVKEFSLAGRQFAFNSEPAIMGVVNLSPDSWYRESVCLTTETAIRRGKILEANEVVSQLLGLRRDEVPHMAWQLSELTVLEPKDITRASRLTMTKSDARWPALSSPRRDRRDGVVLTRGAPSCAGWIDGCRTGRSCPCA